MLDINCNKTCLVKDIHEERGGQDAKSSKWEDVKSMIADPLDLVTDFVNQESFFDDILCDDPLHGDPLLREVFEEHLPEESMSEPKHLCSISSLVNCRKPTLIEDNSTSSDESSSSLSHDFNREEQPEEQVDDLMTNDPLVHLQNRYVDSQRSPSDHRIESSLPKDKVEQAHPDRQSSTSRRNIIYNPSISHHAVVKHDNSITSKDFTKYNKSSDNDALSKLRGLMKESRKSQLALIQFDRKQGLRRNQTPSMMKSNLSRRQLEEGRLLRTHRGELIIYAAQKTTHGKRNTSKRKRAS